MRRRLARHRALPLAFAVAACASPGRVPGPAAPRVPRAISADELRRDLFVFASDSFRGREMGTPDERRAARFLADRLSRLGVEPAGDSGYFQQIPLVRLSLGAGTRFTVTEGGAATTIPLGAQLTPLLTLGEGPLPRLDADGDVVFAGYGITSARLARDDLSPLGDLRGKVVVVVNGAPPGTDSAQRATLEGRPAIAQRVGQLLLRRPAAIVVLLTGKLAEEFAGAAEDIAESMVSPEADRASRDADRPLPMVLLGVAPAGPSPLVPAGWPRDDRARPLTGRRLAARAELVRAPVQGLNVVGLVRGRDPSRNRTYVAFGAHFDHIGVVAPEPAQARPGLDSIANGADDDGSGSVTLLALARAYHEAPTRPRRSVLLVWHGGEEKGLIGSEYFTSHPTVPLDSIVAQINADMIGRNGKDSIYVIGPNAAPNGQSRVLGAIVDSVNAALPAPFTLLRSYDSPTDPEQYYYRSDHYNYAKHGIPIVFFSTGLHADYHKVSDEPQKIDYDKLAHVAGLLFDVGMAVGDREARPR